ncbi:MAG TPA: hypothetical protein VGB46_05585 [Flavisolibacter sp.]|jgi:hypothetical protein
MKILMFLLLCIVCGPKVERKEENNCKKVGKTGELPMDRINLLNLFII